jgi:hypothetical protein
LVGIVVLLVDFLSSEHAQTQLTQDYTESLNNSCKAADFSSGGPLKAFLSVEKRPTVQPTFFVFVTLGNGNPKNSKFVLKQHSAKSDKFSLRIFFKKCPAGSSY